MIDPATPSRHTDAFDPDCIAKWVISRFDGMASSRLSPPLIVPLTVTFAPKSVRPDRVLVEFERLYARLCRQLINNYERPSKRDLLPFAIAWRDDPRTRPDKYRARPAWHAQFFSHPSVAPHVHALMIIHPSLVERFSAISGSFEATWRGISSRPSDPFADALLSRDRPVGQPSYANRTFRIERDLGERLSRGLSADLGSSARADAGAELARWLGYCAKLTRRRDAGEADVFTVLPTQPKKRLAKSIAA